MEINEEREKRETFKVSSRSTRINNSRIIIDNVVDN